MNAPLNIDITQILLHALNFVILAGGLILILYRPVKKFLAERREHYERLEEENAARLEECERLKAEYESKLAEAEEAADAIRRDAEFEMAKRANEYIDAAKEKADGILKAAEEDAEARKAHILEAAQTEIGELVISAAEKLMSGAASPETDSALYDEFIRTAENSKESVGDEDE